jgi:ribosomal protein S18 acetylase RimI-like enzyme
MIEIRLAEPADLDAIQRVVREAYAVYVPRIGREPAPMTADYAALVDAREVRVATDTDVVVGVLVVRPVEGALHLENVAVADRARGQGIGRALVRYAEDEAGELGLDAVELYTNAKMTENLSLYPHLGYEETGRRSEAGFDRVYFRKTLG